MGFKLTGKDQLKNAFKKIASNMPSDVEEALYHEAQIEMTEAKRRTPVWNPDRKVPPGHVPGSLRASGMVHEPERHGRKISVDLTFGDSAVDYAVFVHEDLEAEHATGQAKFLQSVLEESAPHMAQRIANQLDLKKAAEE